MNFYTVPKNADVVAAWKRGATANTAHLSTNGHDLHSYALRIGTTTPRGRKIVGQFDASNEFHSMTTSHHVGIARRVADAVVDPDSIRAMTDRATGTGYGTPWESKFDCCEHCIDYLTGKAHKHPSPCGYIVNLDTPDMNRSCQPHPGDTAAAEFDASPGASGTIPSSWVK